MVCMNKIRYSLFLASVVSYFSIFSSLVPFSAYAENEILLAQPCDSCEYANKVEVLEAFLQEKVPGLDATYRDVFDVFIAEGHEIYLQGGVIRDLFSSTTNYPHDVDFIFSGTVEEMEAIVTQKKWIYTSMPGYSHITIGDDKGALMEGTMMGKYFPTNQNQLDFTVNNIIYHLNSKSFIFNCKEGFEDLENKRLRILASDWKEWLYGSLGNVRYAKLFRVWKMIGKGYIYSTQFEQFIKNETLIALESDGDRFNEELQGYLGRHFEAFGDIETGCRVMMGDKWTAEHLLSIKEEAKRENDKTKETLLQFTHFK